MTEQATAAAEIAGAVEQHARPGRPGGARDGRAGAHDEGDVEGVQRDGARHQADHRGEPRPVGAAARLATQLADIRRITERNAEGVRQTRGGTADLLKQAEALTGHHGRRAERHRVATAAGADRPWHGRIPRDSGSSRPTATSSSAAGTTWLAAATGLAEADVQGRSPARMLVPAERRDAVRRAARRSARHRHAARARAGLPPLPDPLPAAHALAAFRPHAAARHRGAARDRPRRRRRDGHDRRRHRAARRRAGARGTARGRRRRGVARGDGRRGRAPTTGGCAARRCARCGSRRRREEIAHLLESLQRDHHDLNVLSSALQVLDRRRTATSTRRSCELLADPNANLRMHAALALGAAAAIRPPCRASIAALDDEDANVRFHAIEALGRMRAPEAVEPLARIAESGDFFLAFPAIDALGAHRRRRRRAEPRRRCSTRSCCGRRSSTRWRRWATRTACVPLVAAAERRRRRSGGRSRRRSCASTRATRTPTAPACTSSSWRVARRPSDGIARLCRSGRAARGAARAARRGARLDGRRRRCMPSSRALGEPGIEAPLAEAIARLGRRRSSRSSSASRAGGRDGAARRRGAARTARRSPRGAGARSTLLAGADADLVAAAAAALASLGDPRALDALLPLFAHEHAVGAAGGDRRGELDRRGRHGGRACARGSPMPTRTCASAPFASPATSASTAAPRASSQALGDEHEEVRRAAIEQLPVLDDPRALADACSAALRDETAAQPRRGRARAARRRRCRRRGPAASPRSRTPTRGCATSRPTQPGRARTARGDRRAGSRTAADDRAPHVRIAARAARSAALDADAIAALAARLRRRRRTTTWRAPRSARLRAPPAPRPTTCSNAPCRRRASRSRAAAIEALAARAQRPRAGHPRLGGTRARRRPVSARRPWMRFGGSRPRTRRPGQARALATLLELGTEPGPARARRRGDCRAAAAGDRRARRRRCRRRVSPCAPWPWRRSPGCVIRRASDALARRAGGRRCVDPHGGRGGVRPARHAACRAAPSARCGNPIPMPPCGGGRPPCVGGTGGASAPPRSRGEPKRVRRRVPGRRPTRDGVRVPERSLQLLRDLVHAHTGMYYDDGAARRSCGIACRRASSSAGSTRCSTTTTCSSTTPQAEQEWARAIDALSVQETYFWREFDQLRALTDVILPRLVALGRHAGPDLELPVRDRRGAAVDRDGARRRRAGSRAPPIEIHASDASEAALQRARAGRYGGRAFRQLSA